MTTNARFLVQLTGACAVAIVATAYPVWSAFGDRALLGLVAGAAVSAGNCALGFYLLRYAMGRSPSMETAAVMGGFFGRLVIAIGILFLCRGIEAIDVSAMALSIVAFYFLLMLIEVRFLFKNVLRLRPAMKGRGERVDR